MRSNAFKKLAAVALAVTLIVPMNVGKLNSHVAKAAEAQGKIAFNGDFTTDEGAMDFEGWNGIAAGEVKDKVVENVKYSCDFEGSLPSGWNNLEVVDTVKHGGNKAAKAANQQVIFTTESKAEQLEAGKEWIISAWVYSETDTTIEVYVPMWKDGWAAGETDGDYLHSNVVVEGGEWKLLEHVIAARDTSTIVQPRYDSVDGVPVYVDDIKVYYKTAATEEKEVVTKNYDFENNTIEFGQEDIDNNSPAMSIVKEEDNNVLKVDFKYAWHNIITPSIDLVQGREYTISWDLKIERMNTKENYMCIGYPDGKINDYVSFQADSNKLGEWQKMSIKYTPDSDSARLKFQLGNPTGIVYYDNIKVSYTESKPLYVVNKDGVVAAGPNGENALAFAQAEDMYNDTITVTKGNTYAYSFYAKTANTGDGFEFKPYISYGDKVVELNGKQTGKSDWAKYTGTFVAEELQEGETFKIGFARKGTGEVYVTSIELEETAVAETTPAPTTEAPTEAPTVAPTTEAPTEAPTVAPTTEAPTVAPTTVAPTTKKEQPTTTKKVQPTTKKPLDKTKITKKPSKKLSSKKVKLTFKKVKKAKKYTVQFSVKKNFKKVLYTKTVKSTKVTISSSKLKNKKKLYVRVRAVGAKKWSSVVTIKVKK